MDQLRPYLQRMYAERLAALQDAGRAFVDGYKVGLEQSKADTLIEDMADKFLRQTAPDGSPAAERDPRPAEGSDVGPAAHGAAGGAERSAASTAAEGLASEPPAEAMTGQREPDGQRQPAGDPRWQQRGVAAERPVSHDPVDRSAQSEAATADRCSDAVLQEPTAGQSAAELREAAALHDALRRLAEDVQSRPAGPPGSDSKT